jgi:hypothetical protein
MSLEIGLIIAGLLGSVTLCIVKTLHQVQNSKCYSIKCCGSECLRDVEINFPEAEVPQQNTAATQTSTIPTPTIPRPRLDSSAVAALRTKFENKS